MKNAKQENSEMVRTVRREMSRHTADFSEVQITSFHGTVHLHGRVRSMRGHEGSMEESANNFLKALRSRAGVKDVIVEWTYTF